MKSIKSFIIENTNVLTPETIINYFKEKSFFNDFDDVKIEKDKKTLVLKGHQPAEPDEEDESADDYNLIGLEVTLKGSNFEIGIYMQRSYPNSYFTDGCYDDFTISSKDSLEEIIEEINDHFENLESETGRWYGSSLFGNY